MAITRKEFLRLGTLGLVGGVSLALSSVANIALFPLQDVLGLGNEARMNVPGTPRGNWTWRFAKERLTRDVRERLRSLSDTYERVPHGLGHPG